MIKMMIITAVRFWELRQGCDFYISNKFNYITGKKYLLFIGRLKKQEIESIKAKYNISDIYCLNPFLYQFTRYLRAILSKIHLNVFYCLRKPYYFSKRHQNKINNYVHKHNINTVICEYVWFANTVGKISNDVLKIIDTHDIQFKFCQNYKKIYKGGYKPYITQEDEIEECKKFDYTVAVSDADAAYFSNYLKNVIYLPFIFEHKNFVEVEKDILNVGFIGGSAEFNVHAVDWFIKNVLKTKRIDIQFNIYGKVCQHLTYLTKLNQNIVLHGAIDNLDEVYFNNHLIINPTFLIGGMKTKNLEAMNYGKVLITTKEGARGIESLHDDYCMFVANTGDEYIDIISKFQQDILLSNRCGSEITRRFRACFSIKYMNDFIELLETEIKKRTKNVN